MTKILDSTARIYYMFTLSNQPILCLSMKYATFLLVKAETKDRNLMIREGQH